MSTRYNSSKYRVVPLMERIKGDQQGFDALLRSVITSKSFPTLVCPLDDSAYFFGEKNEKKLSPTKEHLIALVEYISQKCFEKVQYMGEERADLYGFNGEEKRQKRKEQAIELVRSDKNTAKWCVFEGESCPDIYVEGEDFVLVCEGKWTESGITTQTEHLKTKDGEYRSQMVRHIQGALNSTEKRVFAFYIVDGECSYLSDLTEDAFSSQIELETIAPIEKERILESFYGYSTWQALEKDIPSLRFLTKKEIDALKS